MSVTYHTYAGPTIQKVLEYLDALGEPQPNALLSVAFGAEDKGDIKAISLIQSLPIVEPFHAEPGFGHHLGKLFEMTQEFIIGSNAKRVLMHTGHPAMKKMLQMQEGVEIMGDTVYDWQRGRK